MQDKDTTIFWPLRSSSTSYNIPYAESTIYVLPYPRTTNDTGNMGGKTWQMEEEEFFWRVVVPQSPEGIELSQRRYSWKQCADLMQQKLGHRGLRNYSKQLLCQYHEAIVDIRN